MKISILIIDDEATIRKFLRLPLSKRGYQVTTATNAREGMEEYRNGGADIILLDMKLPDGNGMDILEAVLSEDPDKLVIVITAYGEIEQAVRAMKLGAFDYVTKPFDFEEIHQLIKKGGELIRLRNEVACFKREKDLYVYEEMVGACPRMRDIFATIEQIASSPARTIYIHGETGTGKELAARAIHQKSERRHGPFVAINCTILDERLLQSELFGHEKGAFTDAQTAKKGLFEVADGGTIFLDEIGDMDQVLQAKLLRVLEEMKFRRLGGIRDISVDLRVITSSNLDLRKKIKEKEFREDLYFRINVVPLKMIPLRERGDDILLLAEYFLDRYNREFGKNIDGFEPEASRFMLEYKWPGNVRELKNMVERLTILVRGKKIKASHLPEELRKGGSSLSSYRRRFLDIDFDQAKKELVENFERSYLIEYLEHFQGNVSQSAREAGKNRTSFQRLMKKYGLSSGQFQR